MSLVDYPLFSWVVVIHSLHVSSFLEAHHQEIVLPVQCDTRTVGSRTRRRTGGLQQILYTRKLTVQEERSPDDELLESSKHVESE